MRKLYSTIFGILLLTYVSPVYATYVLPYPSFMPGNKIYKIIEIVDKVKGYWAWGNIAQVKYHLSLSSKYLVEAKTLMEYKQYKLGELALKRSVVESQAVRASFQNAKDQYESMSSLTETLSEASVVHEETLMGIQRNVPETVVWEDERVAPVSLSLHASLSQAIEAVKRWR